jgi:glycosyltransferase involved in cell wall biosynthesis
VVHIVDRRAFRRADVVVADTEAHARFFREEFGLADDRVEVCFVGAEDRLFRPGWQPEVPFHALFVGKLIPLHGLETILAAAALAPEIPFRVVGSGQLEPLLGARPANVDWVPWVEYEDLAGEIQAAGCALGIFGTGAKASRVIPNKAFQAIACATPLVTADTPAARELLTDGEDALLVPPGDAPALAAAVRRLAGDAAFSARVGSAGRETYESCSSETVLGARWRDLLERAIAAA